MAKLHNSDKVQVANLYLEMQRQGQLLSANDFLSDLTQRLNIESSKAIKHQREDEERKTDLASKLGVESKAETKRGGGSGSGQRDKDKVSIASPGGFFASLNFRKKRSSEDNKESKKNKRPKSTDRKNGGGDKGVPSSLEIT